MAGLIRISDDLDWSASGALFDWTLEFLIDRLEDEDVKLRLQEVVDNNLGSLWLSDFDEPTRRSIVDLLRKDLIPAAQRDLPAGDRKHQAVEQLRELAALAEQVPS